MSKSPGTGDKPADVDHWYAARETLGRLYGETPGHNLPALVAEIARRVADASVARPAELRARDVRRRTDRLWFARPGRPAYCAYADRFGGTLKGCLDRVPHLQALNVGLLHLLPRLRVRDGGIAFTDVAVADFAAFGPTLGTLDDLKTLAGALRRADISLVLDVVCNHTARDHAWAQAWLAGDPDYADFYITIRDEAERAAWSAHLVDFPNAAPGSFSWCDEVGLWVWTTFNSGQWDLNYANPRVFLAMLDVLLNLANAGVDGFRLDSGAPLWTIKGMNGRNLPQTHDILGALCHLIALVAPGTFLLAEAPREARHVAPVFGSEAAPQCHMACNNTAMTALWAAMAEGDGAIFDDALNAMAEKPAHGHWLNYARCHDEIVWNVLDPIADTSRQKRWTRFFAGGESFADGLALQAKEAQADAGAAASICGMASSLCGVADDAFGLDRLKLVYSVVYALDGVPMIYMGDEIALPNDAAFAGTDPDVRWLHRPMMDWNAAAIATIDTTPQGEIYAHLRMLSEILMAVPGMGEAGPALPLPGRDGPVLAFARTLARGRFLCIANLSDDHQTVRLLKPATDLFDGLRLAGVTSIPPWQVLWLHEV